MAGYEGKDFEDWQTMTLTPDQLTTHLDGRIRQHLMRHHEMKSTHPVAEAMKERGRQLLCGLLHDPPEENLLSSPQVWIYCRTVCVVYCLVLCCV